MEQLQETPKASAVPRAEASGASEGGGAALDPVQKSYAGNAALAAAGASLPCAQPITVVNEGGEAIEIRCGTRRKSACPSCAALYAGDAKKLLRDGAVHVEPGSVIVMLTLTAPSFGRVHRVPKVGASPRLAESAQVSWSRRAARSRCACGLDHDPGDPAAGTALDPASYDYRGQAAWNAATGRLWNRTTTRVSRAFGLHERLQYAGVAEMQARGAVHFHLLLRLPVGLAGSFGMQRDSAGRLRARAVEREVIATTTTVNGDAIRWGQQVVAEVIAGPGIEGGRYARRTIGYLVKSVGYVAKDLGGQGFSSTEHHGRAMNAGRWAQCPACASAGRVTSRGCRSPRHGAFGYAGWPVRRSRGWTALTFGSMRQARRDWHRSKDDYEGESCSGTWRFAYQSRSEVFGVLASHLLR